MKSKPTALVLIKIFFSVLVISCNLRGNEDAEFKSESPRVNIIAADLSDLSIVVKAESKSLIYITTNWCNGGALTINSYIYPKLQEFSDHYIKYYIIYVGAELREDIMPDPYKDDQLVTIYHVSNSLFDNAFVHKFRINSFLKELDPSYEFSNAIPVTVFYSEGVLRKIRPSEIDVILGK